MEQLDLIGRTAELARAFGIDFFSVLSRGSQYRVESMMVRLAHTQNYLMLSPAKEQVTSLNCTLLTMLFAGIVVRLQAGRTVSLLPCVLCSSQACTDAVHARRIRLAWHLALMHTLHLLANHNCRSLDPGVLIS